jgi:hypothetical protein
MTATESRNNGHQEPADVAALRQEIARTRAALGVTVEALAAKADVKARAHDAVAEAKTRAKARAQSAVVDAKTRVQGVVADTRTRMQGAAVGARSRAGRTVTRTSGRARDLAVGHPQFVAAGALAGAMVLVTTLLVRRRRSR